VLNQGMSDDDGSISGYSIESTGALTPLSGFPIPIVGFSMAVDSFYSLSQYLYVASSTGIQGFTINSTSGALTPLSGSPFAASGATLLTVVQIPPP
jgi:6-phosphogluconolactonase